MKPLDSKEILLANIDNTAIVNKWFLYLIVYVMLLSSSVMLFCCFNTLSQNISHPLQCSFLTKDITTIYHVSTCNIIKAYCCKCSAIMLYNVYIYNYYHL